MVELIEDAVSQEDGYRVARERSLCWLAGESNRDPQYFFVTVIRTPIIIFADQLLARRTPFRVRA